MTIKTRFAPSPTGFLHIGGVRTALYSWLFARQKGGLFVLRIEDTDRERSTEESIAIIHEGMQWLGLAHDEGPYYQMERLPRYQAVIEQLLESGQAYRCYCSKERLESVREAQIAGKEKPRYDGHCRNAQAENPDAPHVIRFATPESGDVVVHDLIHGDTVFANTELDDLVLVRTDGVPTYNFSVVVDDFDMAITHVIRGADHLNNTPRQINIWRALGAEPPLYAHVPMILGQDGKRLSKRHGATNVLDYREQGILPHALLNYLVRLGWSHGDQELFTMEEMVELFSLSAVNKSDAALDPEKLLWLNQQTIKVTPIDELLKELKWHIDYETEGGPDLAAVVELLRGRAKTLKDLAGQARVFFYPPTAYQENVAKKFLTSEQLELLQDLLVALTALSWTPEALHELIAATVEQRGLKFPQVAQPLRVALTGDTQSPSIDKTLHLMGKEESIKRLAKAIQHIEQKGVDTIS